jgi:hypothetical protein
MVVEACHDEDIMVNEAVKAEICDAFKMAFMGLVDPQAPPVPCPEGIAAALAMLAPDLYVTDFSDR